MPNDLNVMQAQMGLLAQSDFSPLGTPTPTPQVRTPGEVSQEVALRSQAAAVNTIQAAMLTRPSAYGTDPGGFDSIGAFAHQYRANMAGIQAQQFNPYVAQGLAGMGGYGGFNTGMMPSPMMMTPPGMGIFRPFPQAPVPTVPPVPQFPIIPTPFTPHPVSPHFSTPFEYGSAMAAQRGQQLTAAALAAPGVVARGATDYLYGSLGAGVGAYAGARLGGRYGALIGSAVGFAGGFIGSEAGGLGETAQHIIDHASPFRSTAMRAQQLRSISQGFVVGGSELDVTGRGLGMPGAAHLGRLVEDVGWRSGFRKETGGSFSIQDLTRIAGSAGENGLLDMAQGSEALRSRLIHVAKAVKNFMQLANEPDVVEAVRQLGKMRSMGLSINESMQFTRDARLFARMAGTNVSSLMDSGALQGAMVFQQQGLSAGLGVQVGAGAYGMARQAVASNAFTTQQLAMLGGVSGIAQRDMESSAAFLRQPMMAAAMSNAGPGGTFGLNAGNVGALLRGDVGVSGLASMGANNLLAAVGQHGAGALGMFLAQQGELQDQLGRALGPVGLKAMKMRQVLNTQKTLGLSGPGGFVTAASAMGMDAHSALQLMGEANSPETFRNIQRQLEVQRRDLSSTNRAQGALDSPGFLDVAADRDGFFGGLVRSSLQGWSGLGRRGRNAAEHIAGFWTEAAEDAFGSSEGRARRMSRRLFARDAREQRLADGVSSADMDTFRAAYRSAMGDLDGTESLMTVGGIDYGRTRAYGRIKELMGGDASTMYELNRVRGGWNSVIGASTAMRVTSLLGGGLIDPDAQGRELASRQASSWSIARGLAASVTEQDQTLAGVGKRVGGAANARRLANIYAGKLARAARERGSSLQNAVGFEEKGTTSEVRQRLLREAAVEAGVDPSSVTMQEMDVLSGRMAEAMAGDVGANFFKAVNLSGGNDEYFRMENSALEKVGDNAANMIFGENGWFDSEIGNGGRRDLMSDLFGIHDDPRVAVLATLLGDPTEEGHRRYLDYLNSIPAEEQSKLIDQALKVAKKTKKLDPNLMRKAAQGLRGKSNDELTATFKKARAMHLGRLRAVNRRSGATQMFKGVADSSMVDTMMTQGGYSALTRLTSDDDLRAGLTGKAKSLADEFASATTESERERIASEFEGLADASGSATTKDRTSSNDITADDVNIDKQRDDVASLAAEMKGNFPQAVDTFQKASLDLLKAAKYLGRLSPDTTLGVESD